jgi:LysM repeat protein
VPPAPGQTYVVQSGDTLGVIAVRFNTTVEALLVANNLSNANMIYVGQVLALP